MKTLKTTIPIKQQLSDISVDISWAKIAKRYFGKSPSWIYHKIDGIGNNGEEDGGFSEQELEQFKGALYDLAARIRHVADNIQ